MADMVYLSPKEYGKRLRKYNHNKKKIDQAFKTHTKKMSNQILLLIIEK